MSQGLLSWSQLSIPGGRHHFPGGETLHAEYLQRDCFVLIFALEIAEAKTSGMSIKQMVGTQVMSAF